MSKMSEIDQVAQGVADHKEEIREVAAKFK